MDSRDLHAHSVIMLYDASVRELVRIRSSNEFPSDLRAYAQVLLGSYSGHAPTLESGLREVSCQSAPVLSVLAKTRGSLLLGSELPQKVDALFSVLSSAGTWAPEGLNLLGRVFESLGRDSEAASFYLDSARAFTSIGSRRKSVTLEMNGVAAKIRCGESRNQIEAYKTIAEKAQTMNEMRVVGVAHLNVSRELGEAGAVRTALSFAERAVHAMQNDFGSIAHGLALANRARLRITAGHGIEAAADLDQLNLNPHPEIVALKKDLEVAIQEAGSSPAVWFNHRLVRTGEARPVLALLEDRLVASLCESPKPARELVRLLWGRSGESELQRFHRLVARVRKKNESLVQFESGRFALGDFEVRAA